MSAYNIGMLVGIAVALGIFAVIAAINRKRGKPGEFDERQELIRGKAYQHAFFAVMIFSALYGLAVVTVERPLMADGVSALIAMFVGIAVFAVESMAVSKMSMFALAISLTGSLRTTSGTWALSP